MSDKIKDFLKCNYKYVIVLAVGIMILLFSSAGNDKNVRTGNVEKDLCKILEMAVGVGDVDVMLYRNDDNIIEGAIIVAEGAENPETMKMLHDSAVAILNLPEYKIQVLIKQK